jgi:anti-sigma-K factor RskA
MFPPNERPTEDTDTLAGEYVLGVLNPGEAAATRLRADNDPALQLAIGAWQARLVPMVAMLPQPAPPPEIWARLAQDIGMPPEPTSASAPEPVAEPEPEWVGEQPGEPFVEDAWEAVAEPMVIEPQVPVEIEIEAVVYEPERPPAAEPAEAASVAPEPTWADIAEPEPVIQPAAVPPPEPTPAPQSVVTTAFARLTEPSLTEPPTQPRFTAALRLIDSLLFWRAATAASLVLAAAIALFAYINRNPSLVSVAAIGTANAPSPIYLADLDSHASLHITPLAVIAVPSGRDLQLWMLTSNDAQPIPLGILQADGLTVTLPTRPAEGTRFLVTMEPRGGAPSGRITGQVLYGGVLATR